MNVALGLSSSRVFLNTNRNGISLWQQHIDKYYLFNKIESDVNVKDVFRNVQPIFWGGLYEIAWTTYPPTLISDAQIIHLRRRLAFFYVLTGLWGGVTGNFGTIHEEGDRCGILKEGKLDLDIKADVLNCWKRCGVLKGDLIHIHQGHGIVGGSTGTN